MTFREFLKDHLVILDGGMGTLLQGRGLLPGESTETWNLTHPEEIVKVHREYLDAGSNVICANTFGANRIKYSSEELEKIIAAALANAKKAVKESVSAKEKFVALDMGPSGKLLKPLGDLAFEDAVSVFAESVKLGVKYGADLIFIETFNDSLETKAALLAAKENSDLPVIVSNAYGEDGKLMTGASPAAMVALIEGMGADALGANCSLGPRQLRGVAEELLAKASVPVLLKPNAGLPRSENGKAVFDVTPEEFCEEVTLLAQKGIRLMGGCCGTTPRYIEILSEKNKGLLPVPLTKKNLTVVSSYARAVEFGKEPILIGERINPTGKKRLKQALLEKDYSYLLSEGVAQEEKGVHVLDVNAGLPEIDEAEVLSRAVFELQAVTELPLQIDTANPAAMEKALRSYNGKAVVNSVNGKKESMDAVFPLVKKYGGVVIALTLDENGIPETVEGRVAIAEKILETAATYGIERKDVVFDPLALTVSADPRSAAVTLGALREIRHRLSCHTSLGVSNISFGLPARDAINGTFFAMALQSGLSAAIMNPFSSEMMKTYFGYRALMGLDENCAAYIAASETFVPSAPSATPTTKSVLSDGSSELQKAILRGFKERAGEITKELLENRDGLSIIQEEIIPSLDLVGIGFEKKTVYLPQLLMSAEAAKSAFEVIRSSMVGKEKSESRGTVLLATVQGDIHDIGKNIVKLLMENYGFTVLDLGKDVPPETVVEKAVETHASLVGLSALMTTTVPAMEETIALLKEKAPWCKTVVGGAVLTEEYALAIGADCYAKDAMAGVRFAESILG